MARTLRFTEDTEVDLTGTSEIQDVHLHDLSFVAGFETDGDEIVSCDIDLSKLIQAMTLYSSLEKKREGWRRMHG